MSDGDGVTVTTVVPLAPAAAFALFTTGVDAWWRHGPRFRFGVRDGVMRFEPGEGGRLLEDFGGAEPAFEVGRVRVWEPAARLVFDWRARSFRGDEVTRVEVRFEPVPDGTRVTLEHRGWDALRAGHPARHGLEGGAFRDVIGVTWADQLVGLVRAARGPVRAAGDPPV